MGVLLESYAKTVVANFVLLLLEKCKNLMQISLIRYNYTVCEYSFRLHLDI